MRFLDGQWHDPQPVERLFTQFFPPAGRFAGNDPGVFRGEGNGFGVGGSVGAGMHFRATDAATGELLMETVNGRGIAEDRLFYCRFLFEEVPTPSGSIDVIFEVWGLPTPQGPKT
jgi:hypothetical protein